MLIKDKSQFIKGMLLLVSFAVVLFLMFTPLFNGENALKASDRLFNSISKGSTNYIPGIMKQNAAYKAEDINVKLKYKDDAAAGKAVKILSVAGAKATASGAQVTASGSLNGILGTALKDSEALFNNKDTDFEHRYGFGGREALFVWWNTLKEIGKDLTRQKRFKDAKFVTLIVKKAVEPAYNYFGISPQTAGSRAGLLTFALVFYVVYTLWWGIAVLFLFEGFGLQLKAGKKKEV
jgi:hypothetical protein